MQYSEKIWPYLISLCAFFYFGVSVLFCECPNGCKKLHEQSLKCTYIIHSTVIFSNTPLFSDGIEQIYVDSLVSTSNPVFLHGLMMIEYEIAISKLSLPIFAFYGFDISNSHRTYINSHRFTIFFFITLILNMLDSNSSVAPLEQAETVDTT